MLETQLFEGNGGGDSLDFSYRLYSLLQYYKMGERGGFNRIIQKALGRFGNELSRDGRNYLKNLAFNRLLDFGLIETYGYARKQWVAQKNCFIPADRGQCLVFGSKQFVSTAIASCRPDDLEEHQCYRFPRIDGQDIDLALTLLKGPADAMGENVDFNVSPMQINEISGFFPDRYAMSSAVWKTSTPQAGILGNLQKFDFLTSSWEPTEIDSLQDDLVRTQPLDQYRGGRVRSFFCHGSIKEHGLLEIDAEFDDWKFFFAAQLFDWSLGWSYDASKKELSIPRKHLRLMPLLLRRSLLLQSFVWPKIERECYVFGAIEKAFSSDLFSHFKFLEGELASK